MSCNVVVPWTARHTLYMWTNNVRSSSYWKREILIRGNHCPPFHLLFMYSTMKLLQVFEYAIKTYRIHRRDGLHMFYRPWSIQSCEIIMVTEVRPFRGKRVEWQPGGLKHKESDLCPHQATQITKPREDQIALLLLPFFPYPNYHRPPLFKVTNLFWHWWYLIVSNHMGNIW